MLLLTEASFQKKADTYKGFCTTCQKFTRSHTEPDAQGYDCPKCKKNTVCGAEDALLLGYINIK